MGKWTRRDLVKAGLAASAGAMTGGAGYAQPIADDMSAMLTEQALRRI